MHQIWLVAELCQDPPGYSIAHSAPSDIAEFRKGVWVEREQEDRGENVGREGKRKKEKGK